MSSTLSLVFEVKRGFNLTSLHGCRFCAMLFGIQFLNDFASASSKERQFGEELYSSEVKHQRYALCFSLAHICLQNAGAIIDTLFPAVDAYILL